MTLSAHLPTAFSLRDGLSARDADQLASVAQVLERSLPLEPPQPSAAARDRAARARAERERQLAAALEQGLPLLESSGYDIQVLVVLVRLRVEGGGLEGCLDALEVLARMLGEAWAGLTASLTDRADRERDRQQRKWARHVDAAFEQMFSWLARERERDECSLAAGLASSGPRWSPAFETIERGLATLALPVGRFDAVERSMRELAGRVEEAPSAPGGGVSGAGDRRVDGATDTAMAAADGDGSASNGSAGDSSAGHGSAGHGSARDGGAGDGSAGSRSGVSPSGANGPGAASTELRVSPRFWELERRLAAFDALLARGEYEKASIVEADLRESLERFDVAAYFPSLFARYFEGCAAHGERLSRHPPERGALRSAALASLYRTNLERFLELRDPSTKG